MSHPSKDGCYLLHMALLKEATVIVGINLFHLCSDIFKFLPDLEVTVC